MTEENFAVEWLAEEAWAIAAEQQVSALNLTISEGMNQSIQVDKYIQIDETDEAPQGDNCKALRLLTTDDIRGSSCFNSSLTPG